MLLPSTLNFLGLDGISADEKSMICRKLLDHFEDDIFTTFFASLDDGQIAAINAALEKDLPKGQLSRLFEEYAEANPQVAKNAAFAIAADLLAFKSKLETAKN